MNAALADALRLMRPAFPCRKCADACMECRICKTPACPHGFKDATTGDDLKELWRRYPGDLVGVPTGEVSGLFVIDVDSSRHDEANDWLDSVCPHLPPTRWHATWSGGWHILFKHRAGLRSSAGKLSRGVDTRGDGGYVIWWPFHTGLAAPHRLDHDLAELPDWIYERLIEKPRQTFRQSGTSAVYHASTKLRGVLEFAASAHEGERNKIIYWAANRIRDMAAQGEITKAQFDGACSALVSTATSTGISAREAQRTIASAMR
jgi:hypothetical protein